MVSHGTRVGLLLAAALVLSAPPASYAQFEDTLQPPDVYSYFEPPETLEPPQAPEERQLYDGDLRLRDGINRLEGRLEIYYRGRFGGMCERQFSEASAQVACRQMGLPWSGAQVIYTVPNSPNPEFQMMLAWVNCTGGEGNLLECEHSRWYLFRSNPACDYFEQVGVRCRDADPPQPLSPPPFPTPPPSPPLPPYPKGVKDGQLRLRGGPSHVEGRVEVFYKGEWGTVCVIYVGGDSNTGNALCKELGLPSGNSTIFPADRYGRVTLPSLMMVAYCGSDGLPCEVTYGNNSCENSYLGGYHAAVKCMAGVPSPPSPPPMPPSPQPPPPEPPVPADLTPGQLRLRDGPNAVSGRLEIFLDGAWGTICDVSGWFGSPPGQLYAPVGRPNAQVACRQMGLPWSGAQFRSYSFFRPGFGRPIHMDDVRCNGTESTLLACAYDRVNITCNHGTDVGVICIDLSPPPPPEPPFPPSDIEEGTLRILPAGTFTGAPPGQDDGGDGDSSNDGTVSEGIVQIFHRGQWMYACEDGWTTSEANAQVLCRQLGLPWSYAYALEYVDFFPDFEEFVQDPRYCNGTEQSYWDCTREPTDPVFDVGMCLYSSAVFVSCLSAPPPRPPTPPPRPAITTPPAPAIEWGTIRLRGGSTPMEGRLEIFYDNRWGVVCDDTWNLRSNARTVCRELGFPWSGAHAVRSGRFGVGNGDIILDEVVCSGDEMRLRDCSHDPWGIHDCRASEAVGVICMEARPPSPPSYGGYTGSPPPPYYGYGEPIAEDEADEPLPAEGDDEPGLRPDPVPSRRLLRG